MLPRENVFESSVAPLLDQITRVCRQHGINWFATFALDVDHADEETVFSTTVQVDNDASNQQSTAVLAVLQRVMSL